MQTKKQISQIVVVEGHTDTNRLKQIFDVETIETNGSAISNETINLIKIANNNRGVILFLDPDGPGEKIRKTISQHLDNFQNAYITKNDMIEGKTKIGIAEASDDAIISAFKNLKTFNKAITSISWEQYLSLGINSKQKRKKITDHFKIHECNNKQLFKCLNMMGVNIKEVLEIMNEK